MSTVPRTLNFRNETSKATNGAAHKPKPKLAKPPVSKKLADKDAPPTRSEIKEYLSLQEQRRAMESEARQIKAAEDILSEKIFRFTQTATRKTRKSFVLHAGFALSLTPGGRYPSWKNEFIAIAGEAAAADVISNTPPALALTIEQARPNQA